MYECVEACECGSVCAWPSVRKFGACLFLGARLKTGTSQLYFLPSLPLPHTHACRSTCLCNGFDFVVHICMQQRGPTRGASSSQRCIFKFDLCKWQMQQVPPRGVGGVVVCSLSQCL